MPLNWEELGNPAPSPFLVPLGDPLSRPGQQLRQAWVGARGGRCEVERPDDCVTLDMSLHLSEPPFPLCLMGIVPDQDVLCSWFMIISMSWWDLGSGEASPRPGKWSLRGAWAS